MTGRDEWTAYAEIGRRGVDKAREVLAECVAPQDRQAPAPLVRTPNENDYTATVAGWDAIAACRDALAGKPTDQEAKR